MDLSKIGDSVVGQGKAALNAGKMLASGVSAATALLGGDLIGFGSGMAHVVKNAWEGVKESAKSTVNFFKGIFNDPNWWKSINGSFPGIPYNDDRDMSAEALFFLADDLFMAGTGNFSYVNIALTDIRELPGFDLAIHSLYQAMRYELKTNLPYSEQTIKDYFAQALNLLIRAKIIERNLGWKGYVREDIPRMSDFLLKAPANPYETGRIAMVDIPYLGDDGIADAIDRFAELTLAFLQLPVPRKFAELASWLGGTIFADQSASNPQLYKVDVRSIPVFAENENGSVVVTGTMDPELSDSIAQLFHDVTDLLTKYSLMLGDLVRFIDISVLGLTQPKDYRCVLIYDQELFTAIQNGYTEDTLTEIALSYKDNNYLRFDAKQGLPATALIGSLALQGSAGISAMYIISQAFGYTKSLLSNIPQHFSGKVSASVVDITLLEQTGESYVYYQTNGVIKDSFTFTELDTEGLSYTFTANNRVTDPSYFDTSDYNFGLAVGSAGAVSFVLNDHQLLEWHAPGSDAFVTRVALLGTKAESSYAVEYWLEIGAPQNDTLARLAVYRKGRSGYSDLVYSINLTNVTYRSVDRSGNGSIQWSAAGNVLTPRESDVFLYFLPNCAITADGAKFFLRLVQTAIATPYTMLDAKDTVGVFAAISDNFDNHIPFVVRSEMQAKINVYSGATSELKEVTVRTGPKLVKPAYVSFLLTKESIKTTQYQMFFNLFTSLFGHRTDKGKDGSGNKRKKSNRNGKRDGDTGKEKGNSLRSNGDTKNA